MTTIRTIQGDIAVQRADAVVNAANRAMRGGAGVDGAIHRGGGPDVLADCIRRFPQGLETGDAGWTTAGALDARWVIHTVGPNRNRGERDPDLLVSCYRRVLAVADELGATTIAVPLLSAGAYGWPVDDAIRLAIETLATTPTRVEEITVVAYTKELHKKVERQLTRSRLFRMLEGVRVLHDRGFQQVRIRPGMAPSGLYWRLMVMDASADDAGPGRGASAVSYSTGAGEEFAGGRVTATTSPDDVADLLLRALPSVHEAFPDPAYARWYRELLALTAEHNTVPVSFADYPLPDGGWSIAPDVIHPWPPEPPSEAGRQLPP